MIGSLVRWLGLGGAPRASAPRFAPRLEVLDGRTMPSVAPLVDVGGGLAGGVLAGGGSSGLAAVEQDGAADTTVEHSISRANGEEIPQTV